jgi:hypothetical protein
MLTNPAPLDAKLGTVAGFSQSHSHFLDLILILVDITNSNKIAPMLSRTFLASVFVARRL